MRFQVATPAGIEPATFSLEGCCPTRSHPFFPHDKTLDVATASALMYGGETSRTFHESTRGNVTPALPRRYPREAQLPRKKLTDLFVERVAAPAKGRLEYFDASFPGLALRITDKGAKSWSVFYRIDGRLRRFTIGSYPAVKPADARREAQSALDRVRAGGDPTDDKRIRRERRTPETETFDDVLNDYLEKHFRPNNRESRYLEAKRAHQHD